jgi:hypothetical protein
MKELEQKNRSLVHVVACLVPTTDIRQDEVQVRSVVPSAPGTNTSPSTIAEPVLIR